MAKELQKRRKIPLFPIHLLLDHPQAIALSCGGFGMLARLVAHYCKELSASRSELAAIMRAHQPTMKQQGSQIMAIFQDIKPELQAAMSAYKNRRATVLKLAAKGHATLAMKASLKRQPAPAPIPQAPIRAPIERQPAPIPQASQAWRD